MGEFFLLRDEKATKAVIPPDEPARLAAVRRYDILDTPPDGAFDRITGLAARRFDVPISIVSIVDHDRIWFKSHHGLDVEEIGRDPGLCASAILSEEPWILADAKHDVRALTNPLVAGEFGLRFYAGVPLRTHDGHNLGTLCVIDREPRSVDDAEMSDLKDMAALVMDQLELRLSARQAVGQAQMLAREIDHRVMNSLQFVSSMLSTQGRFAADPDLAAQLDRAASRVAAVARVNQHFQFEEVSERAGCLAYLRRLCEDLSGVLGAPVDVAGTEAIVPVRQLQAIGLIVNELTTNAVKHGGGAVTVEFAPAGNGKLSLSICDSGPGLPAGFTLGATSAGLGMRLVHALARQLGGDFDAGTNPHGTGARFIVTFPAIVG